MLRSAPRSARRLVQWLLRCVLLASVLAAPRARAQDTTRVASNGDVATPVTLSFRALMAALNNADPMTNRVETLTALRADQIRLIDVNELVTADKVIALRGARARNADAIANLRDALRRNELVVKALADHPAKPALTNVVAADVLRDGTLIIYYQMGS
jgi:ornithine cyclodeaminase/alanine dehydrogenase-like protein (mu-crystallin family)